MIMTTAIATDHVYFAGDKIRRANLDGTGLTVLWNYPGVDVAVDPCGADDARPRGVAGQQ